MWKDFRNLNSKNIKKKSIMKKENVIYVKKKKIPPKSLKNLINVKKIKKILKN